MKTLKEWAEAHGVTFVGRSAGVYTTGTVSAGALEEIFAEADATRRERDELKLRLTRAHDALEEIALAGMSGTGQESPEAMTDWHARRAWEFIGIAARALAAKGE